MTTPPPPGPQWQPVHWQPPPPLPQPQPPKPFLKTTTAKVLAGLFVGVPLLAGVLAYQEQRAETDNVAAEASLSPATGRPGDGAIVGGKPPEPLAPIRTPIPTRQWTRLDLLEIEIERLTGQSVQNPDQLELSAINACEGLERVSTVTELGFFIASFTVEAEEMFHGDTDAATDVVVAMSKHYCPSEARRISRLGN